MVFILPFLLFACAKENVSIPESQNSLTCQAALYTLAENDGFTSFNEYDFSRGGKNNDQLTLSLSKSLITLKDPDKSYSSSYSSSEDTDILSIYKATENILTDANGNNLPEDNPAQIYKTSLSSLFSKYTSFLTESGCMENGFNEKELNKLTQRYMKDDKLLKLYLDKDKQLQNLLSCKGYDCTVKNNENFVELSDYSDLSIPNSSHLNNDGKIYKNYMNNDFVTYNLVGYNIIMTYNKYNEPISYGQTHTMSYNPLFIQNFIRDIYYRYSTETGPYIYFVYIDGNPANQKLGTAEEALDYTKMTYDTWTQSTNNSMHQFWQDEKGNVDYKMYQLDDNEIAAWLWNRLKENKNITLDDTLLSDYIRIYDYTWQRTMGLREKYYKDFGI